MKPFRYLALFALVFVAIAVSQLAGARRVEAGGAPFTDVADLTGVHLGSVAWGDYDSDGDLDILLTGQDDSSNPVVKIYNNGGGTFTEGTAAEANLTPVRRSSVAWGDYNSDGKPDILLTGGSSSGYVSKIYKNNGNGTFSEDTIADGNLIGVQNSSVAWGDYNSDGKPDILLTGESVSAPLALVSKVYTNNGTGTAFTEDTSANLTGVGTGSVAWGDYNSDGKPDILLTGEDAPNHPVSEIYKNNGGGIFIEDTVADTDLVDVYWSSVAWGDYNSDGKSDILLTGSTGSTYVAKVYGNNGNGTFTNILAGLAGAGQSSAAWGDYNSDGKPDILLTGNSFSPSGPISQLCENNGAGKFPEDTTAEDGLAGVGYSSAAWGDYNSDGKLDILLSGLNGSSNGVATAYQNVKASSDLDANAAPAAPSNLAASISGNQVTFSWSAPTDDHTAGAALGYNLRVGTTPGGSNVVSPLSLASGKRLIPALGNVGERTSYTLTGLHHATFYWSVQAVDTGFAGSAFAAEQQVTLPTYYAFSGTAYSVGEADGTATIKVNRTGLTDATDLVIFQTSDGTATAGSDYTAVSQVVTFAPGETQKNVSVPIADDSLVEGNETVSLSLSSPPIGTILGSPSSATLTIVDNDVAPPPTTTTTTTTPITHPATATSKGKIASCKLSKKSFAGSQAGKVKLTCRFSPKSKLFAYVLSIKKGAKWVVVKSARKTGSFKTYTLTVKQLFAGKPLKRGSYRLKLSADKNSKTLGFTIK